MLLSVLRLSTRRWMELLERMGHTFPQDEPAYRRMEQLLIRENVLESTLRELSHVRGGFGQPSQRYWLDEEETSSDWQATEEG
eukprot:403564-Amphidinium_carterae.1